MKEIYIYIYTVMELSDDAPVHGGRCIFRPFRSMIRRRGRVNQNLIEAVHKSKDDLFSPWIDRCSSSVA